MTTRSHCQHCVACAFAAAMSLIVAPLAQANTIDCGAGDVQCLLAAISQANADPRHKTTIRLAGGTYALSTIDNDTDGPNGLPSIVSVVTIDGGKNGATLTRLPGALGFRILHVGASGRLTLQGVTITNAAISPRSIASDGSGLYNRGVVTVVESSFIEHKEVHRGALFNNQGFVSIIDSTFRGNSGDSTLAAQGSVAGVFSAFGVVDITRTVFENNRGFIGAGAVWTSQADLRIVDSRFGGNSGFNAPVVLVSEGTASITQTTFAGNLADLSGGAAGCIESEFSTVIVRDSAFVENRGPFAGVIFNHGGSSTDVINTTFARNVTDLGFAVLNFGRMTLLNSTFAENRGAIESGMGTDATTVLQNTIVVHNTDDEFVQDCAGEITSLGDNLIGDPLSCIIPLQPSDVTGDAGLGQLLDDGTPGNAHYPLLSDSQAIDAANDAACPKKDQIGRPRAPRCDIGAIEFRRPDVVTTTQ